jgi:hypothetical protein
MSNMMAQMAATKAVTGNGIEILPANAVVNLAEAPTNANHRKMLASSGWRDKTSEI